MRKFRFERASDASLLRYAFIEVFTEGKKKPLAAIVLTDDKVLGIHIFSSEEDVFLSFDEIDTMKTVANKLYEDEMEWERVFQGQDMSPGS